MRAARAIPSSLQVTPASLIRAQSASTWVSQPSRAHNIPAPFRSWKSESIYPICARYIAKSCRSRPQLAMNVNPIITSPNPYSAGRSTEIIAVEIRNRRGGWAEMENSTARSSPSPKSSRNPGFRYGPSLEIACALSLLETDKPRTSNLRRHSGCNKLLRAEMVRLFSASRRPSTLFSRLSSADRASARLRHSPATSHDLGLL